MWDLVGRLFKIQSLRQSVKTHQGFGSIGSFLSTLFQIYLCNCCDPDVRPGCTMWLAFLLMFLLCCSMLTLLVPFSGLCSKCTSLKPGFCVRKFRQYNTICCKVNLISGFFAFSWAIIWEDGINNKAGDLLEKRIPTQGPELDPKFNLNISSFLTLSHLLTWLIGTRNVRSIVFLLQMVGERINKGWLY